MLWFSVHVRTEPLPLQLKPEVNSPMNITPGRALAKTPTRRERAPALTPKKPCVFWPTWFASDNVFLSSEHVPYLQGRFQTVWLEERLGKVPYLLGLKAPYYLFLGRKL